MGQMGYIKNIWVEARAQEDERGEAWEERREVINSEGDKGEGGSWLAKE